MLKMIKRLTKKEILLIFITLLLVISQVYLDLKLPDYMANITTLVQTQGSKMKEILKEGTYMLGCAFGSLIAAIMVGYITAYIASSFTKKLRKDIYTKVGDFNLEEIKSFMVSSLITRTTNDVTQVGIFISMGLALVMKAPITAVWAICKIYNKGFEWSMITAGAVGVLLIMVITLIIIALPKFKIIQTLTDNLNKISRENLTGIRVVRAFNAEKFQENKFNKANFELTKTSMFTRRMMAVLSPTMQVIFSGLTLAIYWVGAYLINDAIMPNKIEVFSNMVVFVSYAAQVVLSFMMLTIIFIFYPRSSVAAKRINEVLETETKIKDGNITKGKTKGEIIFDNVAFKYPDAEEYMLKDISFTAKKGEVVAFIGSTGSGKSTLVNLVPRFYDVTEGTIKVDGVNVKDYKLSSLYDKIAYISQKAVLFSGTVKSNVGYGLVNSKKPSQENIEKAIDVAMASEFVLKMDDKYDSHIARGGSNVSGGQKQRLSVARAIARKPEIYIFDDTFSALDYKTDSLLRKNLKKYAKDSTCLIVAQRIGTIKDADKIIVLEDGKIVGMGKHKELLKDCEVYKEIALSQLKKEELENA